MSALQPLDQKIIKVVKEDFKQRIVRSMMDSSTWALSKMSVFVAIHFWNFTEQEVEVVSFISTF